MNYQCRRRMAWDWRLATARYRKLPDAMIVGAQKAGTTSLFWWLGAHPGIAPCSIPYSHLTKEIHWLDRNADRPEDWYRAHFALKFPGAGRIDMEATPEYLLHPQAARRLHALRPNMKILILLRCPVKRAISQYHFNVRLGYETRPIESALFADEQAVADELIRLETAQNRNLSDVALWSSYLARGDYLTQIKRYQAVFPDRQICLLDFADLSKDPAGTFDAALAFLGLERGPPPQFEVMNRGDEQRKETDPALVSRLTHWFEARTSALEKHLNRRFPAWLRVG